MLKSLEMAFLGSSFQNFPGGEYPRTSLHRSHLQRSYVLPPNFEFVPKPLYYELYCTDHCIKRAFKTWKYRFSVSIFKKITEAYPQTSSFSSLSPSLFRADCRPCLQNQFSLPNDIPLASGNVPSPIET